MTPSRRTRQYFAVGPARYEKTTDEARIIAASVEWIIDHRNDDGTWGGPSQLDRLVTTCHAIMTLLAVGIAHDSEVLRGGIEYLINVDTDKVVSFFWRSGPLLNIPEYKGVVRADIEHMWRFHRRVGAHKDYPIPFFLLKIIRFCETTADLPVRDREVLQWILREWSPEQCWYGRTSITSMALALIYDMKFAKKRQLIARCQEMLISSYRATANGRGRFSSNIVDDCFTVYNLCERSYILREETQQLRSIVDSVARQIIAEARDGAWWSSEPPFGGEIGTSIYPTAVAVRALLSYYALLDATLVEQVASLLIGRYTRRAGIKLQGEPFWGALLTEQKADQCFVLMPFEKELTDIYIRYVKRPIEDKTQLRCVRADDIFGSRPIMPDVWKGITTSAVIIADLTRRNPNVYYELGMAHALGKNVVLICQTIEEVPFDLRGVRTIIYGKTLSDFEALTETLLAYLRERGFDTSAKN